MREILLSTDYIKHPSIIKMMVRNSWSSFCLKIHANETDTERLSMRTLESRLTERSKVNCGRMSVELEQMVNTLAMPNGPNKVQQFHRVTYWPLGSMKIQD